MLSNINLYTILAVHDLGKAMDFYSNTLGLTIVDENPNGIWYEVGNSRLAIYESDAAGTNKATAAIFEVIDPEETVKELRTKGVVFEHFDLPGYKREGDIHILHNFKAAWFKDPSGNLISIGTHL